MKILSIFAVCLHLTIIAACTQTDTTPHNPQWPGFRGHSANGIAYNSFPPVSWNIEESKNIKWKISIPGLSHASPVIWNERLFVVTAVSDVENPNLKVGLYGDIESVDEDAVHEWKIYCINKHTGAILWERTACSGIPITKRHPKSSHANSTPVTDGKYVVAFFGSEGLYCYDMDGKLIWEKYLGILESSFFKAPTAQWGFASSPIIYQSTVIVQCDVENDSFLAAFDIQTGKEKWRTSRDEVATWGTPNVFVQDQKAQVIVNGYKHIGGYDFKTGQEIWKMAGGGDIPVPTPIIANDLIYITNAHGRMSPIYAIKTDAIGDISLERGVKTNEYIVWSIERGGNYMQTPLVYGDYFYACKDNGSLSCFNAITGEMMYKESIGTGGGGFSASPVAANGNLYFTGEKGNIYIIQAGPEYKVVAENSMDDICMATPTISEDIMFFRTQHSVIAIAEQ
jgi:outer membrane protein assembly factor BamB